MQRKNKVVAAVLLAYLVVGLGQAAAATVRGKLVRGTAVVSGVQVTVLSAKKVRSAPAYSGSDGIYYIPNVPAGKYTLEIWATPNKPPLTVPIQVTAKPETNVNPVQLP